MALLSYFQSWYLSEAQDKLSFLFYTEVREIGEQFSNPEFQLASDKHKNAATGGNREYTTVKSGL